MPGEGVTANIQGQEDPFTHPLSRRSGGSISVNVKDEPRAQRLKRVSGIDIETCRACGGAVRTIACIEDPVVMEKVPTHLDENNTSARVSRLPPCRAPPQAALFD